MWRPRRKAAAATKPEWRILQGLVKAQPLFLKNKRLGWALINSNTEWLWNVESIENF